MKEDYIYAVARVRSREPGLLTSQDLENLLGLRDYGECLNSLRDRGWGRGEGESAGQILKYEEEKIWEFLRELTDDPDFFKVLLSENDYNNLKAAIKCVVTGVEPRDVFLPDGGTEPEVFMEAAREGDFSSLPGMMPDAGERAYRALLEEQDGQRCDIILDRACLMETIESAKRSQVAELLDYAELNCALSDIKIAVRSALTGKSLAFLNEALAVCDRIDAARLADAASRGMETLLEYLSVTEFSDAAEILKENPQEYEKYCDDRLIEGLKEQKFNPFGLGPLLGYAVARRREITAVRIILSGKQNGFPNERIRERLRETYV